MNYDQVINQYDSQVQPYLATTTNGKTKWNFTRADDKVRYFNYYNMNVSIEEKERRSIDLLKMVLSRVNRPVVSCSFGVDSIMTLWLTRRALYEMGRDPSDLDVVWNNTLNEFLDVRKFAEQLIIGWNLRIVITKPKIPLKKVIDNHGSVDESYFARKGDRRSIGKTPLSEKCCTVLKHEPMNRAIEENEWNGIINGLRADESSQRKLASLRDGEFFYSSGTWGTYVCRPILWWTEEELWEYVHKYNVPYNNLYDQNLIQKYPESVNYDKIIEMGLEIDDVLEGKMVTKRNAIKLEKLGFKLFTPRTGCQMCPIPVKYGYLQWMRQYNKKVYDAMIYNLGYGKALLKMIPDETKEEIKFLTGLDVTEDNAHEYLDQLLEWKPCIFDKF